MDKNIYIEAVDSIKAPDRAVKKMLDTARSFEQKEKITDMRKYKKTVIAASMAAVLTLGCVFGFGVFSHKSSPFVISVNAAELSDKEYTRIGTLDSMGCDFNRLGDDEVEIVGVFDFGITVTGDDIEQLDYTADGGMFGMLDGFDYYDTITSTDAENGFDIALDTDPAAISDDEYLFKHVAIIRMSVSSDDDTLSDTVRKSIRDFEDHANFKSGQPVRDGYDDSDYDIAATEKAVYSAMLDRLTVRVKITCKDGGTETRELKFSCDNVTDDGVISIGSKLV